MSRRMSRDADPNMYSARVLAISVLPVPVGPTSRKTPSGRVGSVRPALTSATRSTRQSTASGWPMTRSERKPRTASVSSGASGSSIASGRPRGARQHAEDVGGVDVLAAGLGGLLRGGADERQQRAGRRDARQELLGELARLREQLAGRPDADAAAFERVGADGLGGGAAERPARARR